MKLVDQRNQKRRGLTAAGFGGGDDIDAGLDERDGAGLNWGGLMMATVAN